MSSHQPLSFLKDAHKIAYDQCIPWFVNLELSLSCNLTCKHCYNFDRSKPIPSNLINQLPLDRWMSLITELKNAGTLLVSFTGGEALLHPHIFSLIDKCRSENLLVKIKSNGTLIDLNLADKIKKHQVMEIDISLYGTNSEEHDFLTSTPGSFNLTIEGIKNLRKTGIPVEISYILYRKNFKSIERMLQLAEELDCKFNFATELTEKYDSSSFGEGLRLNEEDFLYLLKSDYKEYFQFENSEKSLQCECARTVCAINSKGDVLPCIGAPIKSGNIIEKSFKEIWNNSPQFSKIRNLVDEDFNECNGCEFLTKCSRSSGSAFINTNNYTGKNPLNCIEAKARFKSSF